MKFENPCRAKPWRVYSIRGVVYEGFVSRFEARRWALDNRALLGYGPVGWPNIVEATDEDTIGIILPSEANKWMLS